MAKVTLPMLSMSFKDVKKRIAILETSRTIAEENRLMSEKANEGIDEVARIEKARITYAEQELIKSTILFFSYLEESKIKF